MKNQLQTYCPNLLGDEKFIGTWFGGRLDKLKEEEFKVGINLSIAEVCLLTGLETYDAETQPQMYVAQMRIIAKFILEGFPFITQQELTNAFHLNLQGKYDEVYKQFGKRVINCEFIGQVLSGYKKYKEAYINSNPDIIQVIHPTEIKQIEYKNDDVNDLREMVLHAFHSFCTDPKYNYRLMPTLIYYRLEVDGLMPKKHYEKYIKKAKILLLKEKQIEKLKPTSVKKKWLEVDDIPPIGIIIETHFDRNETIESELHQIRNESDNSVKLLAMQMAVVGYFKYCIKRSYKIYQRK